VEDRKKMLLDIEVAARNAEEERKKYAEDQAAAARAAEQAMQTKLEEVQEKERQLAQEKLRLEREAATRALSDLDALGNRHDIQSSSGKPFESLCHDSLKLLVDRLNELHRPGRFKLKKTGATPHKGDLRIDFNIGDPRPSLTVVVECKDYAGPVPRKEVEKFENDVQQTHEEVSFCVGVMWSRQTHFVGVMDGPRRTAHGHYCHMVAGPLERAVVLRELEFFLRPHIHEALRRNVADSHPAYGACLDIFRSFVGTRTLPALESMRDQLAKVIEDLRKQEKRTHGAAPAIAVSGRKRKIQSSLPSAWSGRK